MSEQYPTQAEYQEQLNEIYAQDPELYDYITNYEAEEPELEWKSIEPCQNDLDFMEYQKYIAKRIAQVFGISLQELGFDGLTVDGSITVPITDRGRLLDKTVS